MSKKGKKNKVIGDATAHTQAENVLQESEGKFRALFDQVMNSIFFVIYKK